MILIVKKLLMKTKMKLTAMLLGLFLLFAMGSQAQKPASPMPDEVKAIINNKCFGCHNTDSKNDKAKDELNFNTLDSLSKLRQISAYKRIGDSVEADEMPPEKFLKHYPEKTLSDSEKELLIQWAKTEAEALVKGL